VAEEFEETEEAEGQFGDPVVIEDPEQELDLGDYEVGGKTLSDVEEETPHQTDLQSAMRAIIPKFKDKRMDSLLQPVMVSRVFPDNYLDLNYLLVMAQIEEHEGDDDIDILGIITGVQVATSKAYEGKHIIDILEIAGVAHEQEMENLSKELGLG